MSILSLENTNMNKAIFALKKFALRWRKPIKELVIPAEVQ